MPTPSPKQTDETKIPLSLFFSCRSTIIVRAYSGLVLGKAMKCVHLAIHFIVFVSFSALTSADDNVMSLAEINDLPHVEISEAVLERMTRGEPEVFLVRFSEPQIEYSLQENVTPDEDELTAQGMAERRNILAETFAASAADRGSINEALGEAQFIYEYRYIPAVSMLLYPAELAALAARHDVTGIWSDASQRIVRHSLEASQNVGALDLHTEGLEGSGRSVAIIDTGVDHDHDAFDGRIIASACFSSGSAAAGTRSYCPGGQFSALGGISGQNCPTQNQNPTSGTAGCAHGTGVASVALGNFTTSSGHQVTGIAPHANLIAIKAAHFSTSQIICDGAAFCDTFNYSDVLAAMDWVIANRNGTDVRAINLSLGVQVFNNNYCDEPSDLFVEAISQAWASGIATVVATGNRGHTGNIGVGHPACIRQSLSVGSTYLGDPPGSTSTGVRPQIDSVSGFSQIGLPMDILAPGERLLTATVGSRGQTNSSQSNAGTSFAAPIVSGAIAVLSSAHPTLNIQEIVDALTSTGVPILAPDGNTYPRIDIVAANEFLESRIQPNLVVSPNVDWSVAVVRGGSGFYYQATYEVSNSGDAATNVTIVADQDWVRFGSATQFNLQPGQSRLVHIRLYLSDIPMSEPLGRVDAVVTFASSHGQQIERVVARTVVDGRLDITPNRDWSITMAAGGTTSQSQTYTLTNRESVNLSYSVSDNQPWLTYATPTTGTLPPGGSVNLTLAIDSSAVPPGFATGLHTATVDIAAGGATQRRIVALTVPASNTSLAPSSPTWDQVMIAGDTRSESSTFSLSNHGPGSIMYTATSDQPWLTFATPTRNSLGPGETTNWTLAIDSADVPSTFPLGGHHATATLAVDGGNTFHVPVLLDVREGPLTRSPSRDWAITMAAAPRNSQSDTHTLTNNSDEPLGFRITSDQPWLTFATPTEGTIPARGNVNFTMFIDTTDIPFDMRPGNYTARVSVDPSRGVNRDVIVVLTVTEAVPPNDTWDNRISLAGSSFQTAGFNVNATTDNSEPLHGNTSPGGRSVWWSWTAPQSERVEVTTAGSGFDTVMGVYTGSALAQLTTIGVDNNSGPSLTSSVIFNATAGETYHFAIDGHQGAVGRVSLSLRNLPAARIDVAIASNDPGMVSASQTQINCGLVQDPVCRDFVDINTSVTFEAAATNHAEFTGWQGDCVGQSGPTCTLQASGDVDVAADFDLMDYTLSIVPTGLGSGTVTADWQSSTCESSQDNCPLEIPFGTEVMLTATALDGSGFAGWDSAQCDSIDGAICTLRIEQDSAMEARFTLNEVPAGRIVAATLPGARSSYVGGPVMTVFMTVLSRATSPAQSCRVTAPGDAPFALSYQRLDGVTPVGDINPLFDLSNGGSLSFIIAMTPASATDASGYTFLPSIACENTDLAPIEGVNSVHLSIGNAPVPDILSIGATASNDGVVRIPEAGNRIAFMAASAVNIGAGDGSAGAGQATVTVSVDTGATSLPVTLEVCESGATGCITPRGSTETTGLYDPNVANTYTVFVRANGSEIIPFSPANSRVFLRFRDANGVLRSATSAAISAPAPGDQPANETAADGRWSVLVRQRINEWPSLRRGTLFVTPDGSAVLDDGLAPRLVSMRFLPASNENATRLFTLENLPGEVGPDGQILAGDIQVDWPGSVLGIRDARGIHLVDRNVASGRYGDSIFISDTGEVRGIIDDCAVFGEPVGQTVFFDIHLLGCVNSGGYTGVFDAPINDNAPPSFLIANDRRGWRIEGN